MQLFNSVSKYLNIFPNNLLVERNFSENFCFIHSSSNAFLFLADGIVYVFIEHSETLVI